MNYYKTGLQMPVHLLGHGRIHVGAVGSWSSSQYRDMANQLWGKASAPFAVVTITSNGESFLVSPYQDKAEASDHYGTVTDIPGKAAYVALFDSKTIKPGESPLIDEAFFQPTEVQTPAPVPAPQKQPAAPMQVKKSSNMGLVLGLAAAAGAGLYAFKPKRANRV